MDADGIAVVGSAKVSARALHAAADVIVHMLSLRSDLRQSLVDRGYYYVVMAENEWLSEMPGLEYLRRDDTATTADETLREHDGIRGLAGGHSNNRPFAVSNEEGLLRRLTARTSAISEEVTRVVVHEFAHAIHLDAIRRVDSDLFDRINDAYDAAVAADLWTGEYIATNANEYWADGANMWFNNLFETSGRPQNTREELLEHDPQLHALLSEVFPTDYIPGFARYPNPSEESQSSENQTTVPDYLIPRHLVPRIRNYE